MTPEGGTSIQASLRLAAGLLLYLRCASEVIGKRSQSKRLVPGTCRKMLKGLWLKLLGRPAVGHSSAMGKGCMKKGKDWGNRHRKRQFAAQVAWKAGYAS